MFSGWLQAPGGLQKKGCKKGDLLAALME